MKFNLLIYTFSRLFQHFGKLLRIPGESIIKKSLAHTNVTHSDTHTNTCICVCKYIYTQTTILSIFNDLTIFNT